MNLSEKDQLEISIIVIAVALGIAFSGGIHAFDDLRIFFRTVVISAIGLFLSFGLHELSHRFTARAYGFNAVYRMWIPGLIIAIGTSFLGFIFLAPGFVEIKELDTEESIQQNKNKLAVISLTGPLSNIILALVFLVLFGFLTESLNIKGILFLNRDIILDIIRFGLSINVWFALFNMIPMPPLDGWKVFSWNKEVWFIMTIVAGSLFFFMKYKMDFILSLFR